jgi:acetoacetyl-CoA synthetase
MKCGEGQPPIVIAHGLSGTIQVTKLAQHVDTPRPIYGLQAKGLDGLDEPFDRLEEMAQHYIGAIDELCQHQPCILIGYSFGGLVALEIAQRYAEKGKPVPMLILLDAYPHPRFMPLKWRTILFARRMWIHAQRVKQLPLRDKISYFVSGAKRRGIGEKALAGTTTELVEPRTLAFRKEARRRVNHYAYRAYENYRPRYFPGKISFVTTAEKTFFPGDPFQIWKPLTKEFEMETIPGNHLNILTTEFLPLAAVLSRYLQKVT